MIPVQGLSLSSQLCQLDLQSSQGLAKAYELSSSLIWLLAGLNSLKLPSSMVLINKKEILFEYVLGKIESKNKGKLLLIKSCEI